MRTQHSYVCLYRTSIWPYDNDDRCQLYVWNQKSHIFPLDPIGSYLFAASFFIYLTLIFHRSRLSSPFKNFYMINFAHANSLIRSITNCFWLGFVKIRVSPKRMHKQCVLIFTSLIHAWQTLDTSGHESATKNHRLSKTTTNLFCLNFGWCSSNSKRLNREKRSTNMYIK